MTLAQDQVPAFTSPALAAQNGPTCAPPPATAPAPRTTALGAPRANVGALVGAGDVPPVGLPAAGTTAAPVLICFGGLACCAARALAASALAARCNWPNKRLILSGGTPRS